VNADAILSRLERVKRSGPGRWIARCPAHDDRTPSFSIRETDDGRLLLHCFAGCSVADIVAALGLTLSDLMPPREIGHAKPERRPFFPADIFEIARHEIRVVFLIGADLHKHKSVSEEDYQRLLLAVGRLGQIGEAYGSG